MKTVAIIATYNGAAYIIEQLESIMKQTQAVDEVFIRDDRSTDLTVFFAKNWIESNNLQNKWHIEVNEKTLGYANNFNILIKEALSNRADLLFLVDQDDIWVPNKVEYYVREYMYKMDNELFVSPVIPFYTSERAVKISFAHMKPGRQSFSSNWIMPSSPGCAYMMTSAFAESYLQILPFLKNTYAHDDLIWSLAILTNKAYNLGKPFLYFRRHGNNSSNASAQTRLSRITNIQKQLSKIEDICNNKECFTLDEKKVHFLKSQHRFYKKRSQYLQEGWLGIIKLTFVGIINFKYYMRCRNFIADILFTFR